MQTIKMIGTEVICLLPILKSHNPTGDTSAHDRNNLYKGVHFFVDDYRFESTYNKPEPVLNRLKKYRFLLTPDFSLYSEMESWRQIESIGKARWVGAFWQSQGCTVIPTISWSRPSSYRFCFRHGFVCVRPAEGGGDHRRRPHGRFR